MTMTLAEADHYMEVSLTHDNWVSETEHDKMFGGPELRAAEAFERDSYLMGDYE
jgi:hypothetical protein